MVKYNETYTDYNGVERTEEFRFNLSKAELIEMEASDAGGMSARINRIVNAKDNHILIGEFKEILLKAYGVLSDDGRRLEKSPEISAAFEQTEAYSNIFVRLLSDSDEAVAFIQGIMPKDMIDQSKIAAISKNK